VTAPKPLRRQMTPGSTYRKPGPKVAGLPRMNTPTVGKASRMMPSAKKVGPVKPIKPLTGLKQPKR
jgi:hypothetical protein